MSDDSVDYNGKTATSEDPANDNGGWLEVPRSGKISETIARDILNDVVVRKLKPGTVLASESVMLTRYGVGRASLREALRILEIHGLIKIKPGPRGGPVVAQVTSKDFGRSATLYFHAVGATFEDLLAARLAIEPIMARQAAENLSDDGAAQLRQALADQERGAEMAPAAWGQASVRFHVVVNGLSGNRVLDLVCRSLLDIYAGRTQGHFPVRERPDVLHAHQRIAESILDGDAETAELRMRRHVEQQLAETRDGNQGLLDELIDWR